MKPEEETQVSRDLLSAAMTEDEEMRRPTLLKPRLMEALGIPDETELEARLARKEET